MTGASTGDVAGAVAYAMADHLPVNQLRLKRVKHTFPSERPDRMVDYISEDDFARLMDAFNRVDRSLFTFCGGIVSLSALMAILIVFHPKFWIAVGSMLGLLMLIVYVHFDQMQRKWKKAMSLARELAPSLRWEYEMSGSYHWIDVTLPNNYGAARESEQMQKDMP